MFRWALPFALGFLPSYFQLLFHLPHSHFRNPKICPLNPEPLDPQNITHYSY